MKKSRGKKDKKINKPRMVSYGSFVLPPIIPGPEVEDLCHKIDNFYNRYYQKSRKQEASDLIKGAFYAIRPECRSNPDWMSQAANSLRDVLYPFWSKGSKNNLLKLFKKYAADKTDKNNINDVDFIDTFNDLDAIYGKATDITHHGIRPQCFPDEKSFCKFSEKDFESLIEDFTVILGKALGLQQIYTHRIIDAVVAGNKRGPEIISDLNLILNVNIDSREYFFAKADERWLVWLWRNKFLDVIKEKAKIENKFLPELQYLSSVSEKNPEGVVDIILKVDISEKNFNPVVVSRFLWICGSLPADQLERIVSKIRDEKWVQLMRKFTHFDFEYGKMFDELYRAKNWKKLFVLAEAVLSVCPQDEISEAEKKYGTDNPFYFKDFGQIKVFEYLIDIDDQNLEKALTLVLDVMKNIITNSKRKNESKFFEVADNFGFYDVDFFTLKVDDGRHLSYRDDVKNLAAAMKALTKRMFEKNKSNPKRVKELYKKYVEALPLSQTMWRFRLYVLTLCPEIFKEELKNTFFKFFEEPEESFELISGAEYQQALKRGFHVLSDDDQRHYVKKVVGFFGKKRKEEKEEPLYKYKGREILSCVYPELSDEERANATKILGDEIKEDIEPQPSIVHGMANFIAPKAPIALEDLQKKTVPEIVEILSKEWTPENLRKLDSEKDFMRPLNAEGMGNLLKQDIEQRFELYIANADLFFDRGTLDEHYTYSFLQGVYDVMRQDKYKTKPDCNKLLTLIENIIESGKKEKFSGEEKERERYDSWVANWRSVHYAMADVMKVFLGENKDAASIGFPKYRERLLDIIKYLLSYPDPDIESNAEDYGNDPFSIAINSVRGRSFESLVLFVYRDGDSFKKEDEIKISEEVKEIYKDVLEKDDTYAVMFLFGHYLSSFYYRDKKWIKELIPKIFPDDSKKRDLYIAAWEGYIATNIYGEMFSDFKFLYERAMGLNLDDYTKRQYFRDLDEGLATHLALAYVHFSDFNIDSELFKLFWSAKNAKSHKEFVSFVGRHAISRDNAAGFISENKIDVGKIKDLWNWVLENVEEEDVFSGFGFWVDKEQDVFKDSKWLADHIKKTLEKSKGGINWDYGLIKSLPNLAEQAPEETYEILKIYLLDQYENKPEFRNSVYIDDFLAAFNVLYNNGDSNIKSKIHNLISELILKGSSRFWKLKEVIENNKN